MILTSTEPIFFTEIDDDEPDIDRGTPHRQINVEELNNLMTTCDVKDLIEDDLTVDSIQNNKTQSILIDDVFEDDRSLSNDRDNINEPDIENMKLSSIDVESASTEPVHDLENEQNEKGLLIDTKHKMFSFVYIYLVELQDNKVGRHCLAASCHIGDRDRDRFSPVTVT